MTKLIFGAGYLGLRVARLWRNTGHHVTAVTRTAERARQLASEGLVPIIGNPAEGSQLPIPQGVRTVLFAVGYDRLPTQARSASEGLDRLAGQTIHDVYAGGLERALAAIPDSVERFLYISSTGVYGQVAGEEVDEDSPCAPEREGGQACLAAEELLRASRFAERAIVLRLAGIYGPGRVPRAAQLLQGAPVDAPAHGWLNLIHVDDAAQIVLLADEKATPPKTYVVSDGQPVQRSLYYQELARLLGAPPPRFEAPSADSPATQRAASDKRINPRRLFAELSPPLRYPSYREGLAKIVGQTFLSAE